MDRSDALLDWWRANGSVFQNLESVLPFIVCEKVPDAGDETTRPLLVGAQTFQSSLVGSCDPKVLDDALAVQPWAARHDALTERRRVYERWEPEITFHRRPWKVEGRAMDMTYIRFLAPIRLEKGGAMLITHTAQCPLH